MIKLYECPGSWQYILYLCIYKAYKLKNLEHWARLFFFYTVHVPNKYLFHDLHFYVRTIRQNNNIKVITHYTNELNKPSIVKHYIVSILV